MTSISSTDSETGKEDVSYDLASYISSVHLSSSSDFVIEQWTPRLRCNPTQFMQRNMPRLDDAHFGLGAEMK